MNENQRILTCNYFNNGTSYKGSDIKAMTLNRIRKMHTGYMKEFYTKYFSENGKYKVNPNHYYFIKMDRHNNLYLSRDQKRKR